MQIARQTYFKDRCVYYSTFPIQEQALKGEKWKYKLTPVYTIAILDFESLDEQPEYYHEVKLIDVRTKEVFYDKLTYFFLELRKFNKRQDELVSNFERWIYLLKHLSRLENRPVELQGRVFDMLFRAAEIARFTPEEMKTYSKSVLEYNDVRSAVEYAKGEGMSLGREVGREEGMRTGMERGLKTGMEKGMNLGRKEGMKTGMEKGLNLGREEGMETGMKKGIEKGKILVARKCLEKNMSVDDISDLTGLSKKQILQLR
jgi:predicted transposase/invertase (TIGR01784 family)